LPPVALPPEGKGGGADLNPDLGFFHALDYGKPAMALDLEEEFRPIIVDSLVLTAVNRQAIRLQDFAAGRPVDEDDAAHKARPNPSQPASGKPRPAIFMQEAARKRFIALYETRLNEQIIYPSQGEKTTYRRILELQAYQMARVILGETAQYVPFTVR
jgi:CRISPR-associated protein Cas1